MVALTISFDFPIGQSCAKILDDSSVPLKWVITAQKLSLEISRPHCNDRKASRVCLGLIEQLRNMYSTQLPRLFLKELLCSLSGGQFYR